MLHSNVIEPKTRCCTQMIQFNVVPLYKVDDQNDLGQNERPKRLKVETWWLSTSSSIKNLFLNLILKLNFWILYRRRPIENGRTRFRNLTRWFWRSIKRIFIYMGGVIFFANYKLSYWQRKCKLSVKHRNRKVQFIFSREHW